MSSTWFLTFRMRCIIPCCVCNHREANESETTDTDDDSSWGGLGFFEYSQKGLPHALVHATELVETFGHHGACCTCVGEAGHKVNIKQAARFSRTYASKNTSQAGMLQYVQRQNLWSAVMELNGTSETSEEDRSSISASSEDSDDDGVPEPRVAGNQRPPTIRALAKLMEPLAHASCFNTMVPDERGRPPRTWGGTFLSNRVLITRTELITLLRTKLNLPATWENVTRLATQLDWQCFGCAKLRNADGDLRKVVGTSNQFPRRRDFVHLSGHENNTALSVQVVMFIQVSGLGHAGIQVPEVLRIPRNNTCTRHSVVLAVVRWLAPDRRSLLRDSKFMPLCPPPFGSNHALWTFQRLDRQRGYFSDHIFARQLHLFPGSDRRTRRRNADTLSRARYDLVTLESIDSFMNCTTIDNDSQSILETIMLPFNNQCKS